MRTALSERFSTFRARIFGKISQQASFEQEPVQPCQEIMNSDCQVHDEHWIAGKLKTQQRAMGSPYCGTMRPVPIAPFRPSI
jgi:hypothetical protein